MTSKKKTTKKKAVVKKTATKKVSKKKVPTKAKISTSEKNKIIQDYLKKEEEKKALASGKYGDEPWVDVKAAVIDPEKGAKIELDWNDAFINYLKDYGYTGVDENAIIQKYIAVLLRSITEDMVADQKNQFE